jgi:hypothetical protein
VLPAEIDATSLQSTGEIELLGVLPVVVHANHSDRVSNGCMA